MIVTVAVVVFFDLFRSFYLLPVTVSNQVSGEQQV